MLNEFIKALFFIFAAEMGDKTQILAMTFATQYNTGKVLMGVLIGSFLNHGLAIALGTYLSNFFPISRMQIIAGFAFIAFGLWALRYDDENEDSKNNRKVKLGPVLTVSLAFFVGELGDKTQLTAMTLATEANFPIFILLGTVAGMIITSGVGIFIGKKIGKKIPEIAIKFISSGVFIFFGTLKLIQSVPQGYINAISISIFIIVLGTILTVLVRPFVTQYIKNQKTPLREAAATLYTQVNDIKKAIDDICLGNTNCGRCEGNQCLIGFVKSVLEAAQGESPIKNSVDWSKLPQKNNSKSFDQDQIVQALSMIIDYLINNKDNSDRNQVINKGRQALEMIAFKEVLPDIESTETYLIEVGKRDKVLMTKIEEKLDKIDKGKRE